LLILDPHPSRNAPLDGAGKSALRRSAIFSVVSLLVPWEEADEPTSSQHELISDIVRTKAQMVVAEPQLQRLAS
jgi:hypothetical protein